MTGEAPLRLKIRPQIWHHIRDLDSYVAIGVGPDETVVELHGSVNFRRRFYVEYVLTSATITTSLGTRSIELESTKPVAYAAVQPLSTGGIAVVSTRARAGESNGITFDAAGRVVATYPLDDGISHFLADSADTLWVGYFDEGVFGGGPYAPNGLCRFDTAGNLLWAYMGRGTTDTIDDCYALNVAGTEAWAYYYAAFNLMRVRTDGRIDLWRTGVMGAGSILVDDNRAVLLGTYDTPFGAHKPLGGRYLRFEGGVIVESRDALIEVPDGLALDPGKVREGTCRGSQLYVQDGPNLFVASLKDAA